MAGDDAATTDGTNTSGAYRIVFLHEAGDSGIERTLRCGAGLVHPISRASSNVAKQRIPKNHNATFTNPIMSREHAEITYVNEEVCVTDLSSSYGTFLNGGKLVSKAPTAIRTGDKLRFGIPLSVKESDIEPTEVTVTIEHVPFIERTEPTKLNSTCALESSIRSKYALMNKRPGHTKPTSTYALPSSDEDDDAIGTHYDGQTGTEDLDQQGDQGEHSDLIESADAGIEHKEDTDEGNIVFDSALAWGSFSGSDITDDEERSRSSSPSPSQVTCGNDTIPHSQHSTEAGGPTTHAEPYLSTGRRPSDFDDAVKYNYEIKAKAMALQVATKRAALCVRLSEKAVAHAGATGDAIAVKECERVLADARAEAARITVESGIVDMKMRRLGLTLATKNDVKKRSHEEMATDESTNPVIPAPLQTAIMPIPVRNESRPIKRARLDGAATVVAAAAMGAVATFGFLLTPMATSLAQG